jgi:cell division protein FtsZ
VVVGTVIDPELQDELRVTVVATGLNRLPAQGRGGRDGRDSRDSRDARDYGYRDAPQASREAPRAAKRPAPTLAPVANSYADLDRPAVQRYARAVGDGMGPATVDEELLDIPAFLRRQAD